MGIGKSDIWKKRKLQWQWLGGSGWHRWNGEIEAVILVVISGAEVEN
jgi:hypothetical protein